MTNKNESNPTNGSRDRERISRITQKMILIHKATINETPNDVAIKIILFNICGSIFILFPEPKKIIA